MIEDWKLDGLCRQVGSEMFFSVDSGGMNNSFLDIKGAIGVCRKCPVRQECEDYAIADDSIGHGIWGGRTARSIREEQNGYIRKKTSERASVGNEASEEA